MKKLYFLFFYKLNQFFKATSDDGLSSWKALIVIGCIQMALIIELYVWCDILFPDQNVEINPFAVGVPLALVISAFNYYALMHNDKWKFHEKDFTIYSKVKSRTINFLCLLFIAMVIGSVIFAFYKMSLIDWTQYR